MSVGCTPPPELGLPFWSLLGQPLLIALPFFAELPLTSLLHNFAAMLRVIGLTLRSLVLKGVAYKL